MRLLEDERWRGWSNREIARCCKVSPPFVAKVRSEVDTVNIYSMEQGSMERAYTTKHGSRAVLRLLEDKH
jgi:hypothetical protein